MFQINHYAIHKEHGVKPILFKDAPRLNHQGWDIYWTPNNFSGHCRKKENLAEITCFFADIDGGDRVEQLRHVMRAILPSCVIETKNGYHVYWYLKEFIDCRHDPVRMADWFRYFQVKRIVPALNADPQAADACRLMRSGFYRYWKDGKGDFWTDIVFDSDRMYSLEEIEGAFPVVDVKTKAVNLPKPKCETKNDGSFWKRANSIDVLEGLKKLSGTHHCKGETIGFKKNRITINGKAINAWIDKNGLIGSVDRGGPTIPNWLHYYHRNWQKVAEIIKEVFPEVCA